MSPTATNKSSAYCRNKVTAIIKHNHQRHRVTKKNEYACSQKRPETEYLRKKITRAKLIHLQITIQCTTNKNGKIRRKQNIHKLQLRMLRLIKYSKT